MTVYGFHASQEQIAPSQLLEDVQQAERAGFEAAMSSDHFMPWSVRQGHSGFTFSWLGAALAATDFSIGSVFAPGQRYHPALAAQATATLGEMFPGRYWAALGAGQNMNEHVTGQRWPTPEERRTRLEESVGIIRALHHGEWIHRHEGHTTVDQAHVWDRPEDPVPLYAACLSEQSARRAAAWAGGMITVNQPDGAHREARKAYREAGGTGPVMLQIHLSWAETQPQAEEVAFDQWRTHVFGPPVEQDLPTPQHFDAAAQHVRLDSVLDSVWTSSSTQQHAEWIGQASQEFDAVYLHHVGQNQAPFIEAFGQSVLPVLKGDL